MFRNIKLKTRGKFLLIPFFDFILALIILTSILNILMEYKTNLNTLNKQHFTAIKTNAEIMSLLIETHNHLYTLIKNSKNLDEAQIYKDGIYIFKYIRTLQQKVKNQNSLKEMNKELEKYLIISKEIVEMSSVDLKLAISYYDEANSQFVLLTTILKEHGKKSWEDSENYLKSISLQAQIGIEKFSLISIILMSIAIFIAFFISKILSKELISLIKIMNLLASGNYKNIKKIPYTDKKDEIGEMANAVTNFKNTLEQLDLSKNKIIQLNLTLEDRIKNEVAKNRGKDKQIIEQSRLAQMGEMISMIAHQWRQPLSAISSASSSLELKAKLNKLNNKIIIEQSRNISKYSQHLSATINDFREFFKPNKQISNTTYDEIIQNVLNIIETSIINKNITIIKKLNSKEIFNTHQNELKQVLLNLIKNAEDALLEKNIKNPTITIETKDNLLIVKDNGGGIEKDIIDKIFDPYFSTKIEKNGTGLGLYMSKMIIEEHCNGKLTASNDKDGAVFKITLVS